MSNSTAPQEVAEPSAAARPLWPMARALLTGQVLGALGLLATLLCSRKLPTDVAWAVEFAVAATLLSSGVWSAVRRPNLSRELSRLARLLPLVRQSIEPIDSLSGFRGAAAPVAELCREFLRDLRQERSRTGLLEGEIRQRIAGRTEALERQIGALRQQASRDGLTGLFNRRMLDAYLSEAVERCKASREPLSVLMIDVDHFKQLNDTLGHATGDEMLRSIAQIIRSAIGETDVAFRCGGDEFVIVLEGSDPTACETLSARLASLGDALGRTYRLTPSPRLSIGTSSLAGVRDAAPHVLLRAADEALYQVKAAHHAAVEAARPRRSA